ncbi:MAG: hypothetical protein WC459_02905 [Patescibacteria group bacterium]
MAKLDKLLEYARRLKLEDVRGLPLEYRHRVCGVGNHKMPRCRFLRYIRVGDEIYLVCSKGTEIGERHSKRIDALLEENSGGLLKAETGDGKKIDMAIIYGDNCDGRAEEFAYLFEENWQEKGEG